MAEYLECPYCKKKLAAELEVEEEDEEYETNCGYCGKDFIYSYSVSVDTHTRRIPCGDDEHEFMTDGIPIPGSGNLYYECVLCGKFEFRKPDE